MKRTITVVPVLVAAVLALAGCAGSGQGHQPAGAELSTGLPGSAHPGPPAVLATGCPATQPGTARAAGSLVAMTPNGPTGAQVCRYEGANDPNQGNLAKQVHVNAATASRLATAFNGSKSLPTGSVYNCPNDTGMVALVVFEYPRGRQTTVTMSLSGCRTATNGHRVVFYPQSLATQVDTLTGTP